jgi:hypothetical protein
MIFESVDSASKVGTCCQKTLSHSIFDIAILGEARMSRSKFQLHLSGEAGAAASTHGAPVCYYPTVSGHR